MNSSLSLLRAFIYCVLQLCFLSVQIGTAKDMQSHAPVGVDSAAAESAPFFWGLSLGINQLDHHDMTINGPGVTARTGIDRSYTNSPVLGIGLEYRLRRIQPISSLQLRLVYHDLSTTLEARGDSVDIADLTGWSSRIPVRYRSDVAYRLLATELLVSQELADTRIGLALGAALGLAVGNNARETLRLAEPEDFDLSDGDYRIRSGGEWMSLDGEELKTYEGEVPGMQAMRLAIKFGVRYPMPLRGFSIVPSLWYEFGVNDIFDADHPAAVNAVQLIVDFLWDVRA